MQYSFVLNLTMKLSQRMQLSAEFYNRDAVQTCTEFNHELSAHSDHHHESDYAYWLLPGREIAQNRTYIICKKEITHN